MLKSKSIYIKIDKVRSKEHVRPRIQIKLISILCNFRILFRENMVTQTFSEVLKKKIYVSQGTSMEDVNKKYVAWNFSLVRTINKIIVGKIHEES